MVVVYVVGLVVVAVVVADVVFDVDVVSVVGCKSS